MLGFLKSNSAPIAIDFGYAAVKVLQIQAGDPLELLGAAVLEIPAELRSDQFGRQEFLTNNLPPLIQEGGFKGKVACCSIPAWQTFVQHLQLDKSDGTDLNEQVEAQLQMAIAIDPSQAVIRHVVAGDVFREGKSAREVIAFAVSREVVMAQVELLKKCKLEVAGFHAEPLAVLQAYRHLYRREGDENTTTLYLDIGYHGTQAVIAHGAEMKFAKSIPVGGRHFDQEIARALHCTVEEAFTKRMQTVGASQLVGTTSAAQQRSAATTTADVPTVNLTAGSDTEAESQGAVTMTVDGYERRAGSVPREFQRLNENDSTDQPAAGASASSSDPNMNEAMADVILQFVDELRMCVRYHRAMSPDRAIDRMIINGGESRNAEMCRRVATILGVKTFVGDPMKRVHVPVGNGVKIIGMDGLTAQPAWAVPMGLCLSPIEGK